jgi:tetratricopeptide (TPR) repeat protein
MTRTPWAAAALLALGCAGIGATQPRLAATVHRVREREDVYPFPPPPELHAATLGWDAAVVDILWATLLVAYGTHWSEHREFVQAPLYIDAILELEPTYWPAYNYVDTLLVYRPLQGTADDARMARKYLLEATTRRPEDWRAWVKLGQFLAFLGPPFLGSGPESDAWRQEGAAALVRAAELGADADQTLVASSLLTDAGARDVAIRSLEHAYEFTPEGSEAHIRIGRRLQSLQATRAYDAANMAAEAIAARWRAEIPFVTRDAYLLLGPTTDAALCSGPEAADDRACARDWDTALAAGAPPTADGVGRPASGGSR